MELLEKLFTPLNIVFYIVILTAPRIAAKMKLTKNDAAGLATSLGVLGTFVGIFYGLMEFDTSDIGSSVPPLLDGLKIAFSTSILGMTTAMFVKNSPKTAKFYGFKEELGGSGSYEDKMVNIMDLILKSIGGDTESSLTTHMAKMRLDFRDFAQSMAKQNTDALIESLQKVVTNFNDNLIKAFGKNFEELNAGVKELVVWQQQHKNHVESMTAQFERTLLGVQTCEQQLADIVNKAKAFSTTAQQLQQLLTNLDTTFVGIDNMAKTIPQVFPQIQNTIKNLTENFANDVKLAVRQNNEMLESQKTAINRQIDTLQKSYTDSEEHQTKLMATLKNALDKQTETITQQMTTIDAQLSDILKRTLQNFSDNLVSISQKFTNDYGELANILSKLHNLTINK